MLEEVYNYLHDYGFSSVELDEFEKVNNELFFTNISEVRKNIVFLEEKYLNAEDIIKIVNVNPFILTEKNNRLEALEEIYKRELIIDYESLKKLIMKNPEAYTISPIELQKIIDYLKENDCSIKSIRELILKNPKIINMNFDNFKKIIE